MRKLLLAISYLLLFSTLALAQGNGLVTIYSAHSVKVTTDRLVSKLTEKRITLFIRIDYSAGAKKQVYM